MKKYPDLIKGFDLLQQEDNTHWTVEFANELLSEEDGQSRAPFFFHSGETGRSSTGCFNEVRDSHNCITQSVAATKR